MPIRSRSDMSSDRLSEPSDFAGMFRRNWKLIASTCTLGIFASLVYLLKAPKEYAATVQLKMAMYSSCMSDQYHNEAERVRRNDPECAKDIETPQELIARLRLPVAYTSDVIKACGESADAEIGPFLNGKIRAHFLPGVEDGLELKLRLARPDTAKSCANALFSMIKAQQQVQLDKKVAELQRRSSQIRSEITQQDRQLERVPQNQIRLAAYLQKFNELSSLGAVRERLNEQIVFATGHPTELLTPIYAPTLPASRSRSWALLLGAFAGLAAGLALAELARLYRKLPD